MAKQNISLAVGLTAWLHVYYRKSWKRSEKWSKIKIVRGFETMSQHYNKFLSLLERWPVDKNKLGRDLGQYLRDQLTAVLGSSNIIAVKDERLNKQFLALENIVNDVHGKRYPRALSSTATGLSGEQCREVLSTEFLQILQKNKSKD